jgi:hypothetical protein
MVGRVWKVKVVGVMEMKVVLVGVVLVGVVLVGVGLVGAGVHSGDGIVGKNQRGGIL